TVEERVLASIISFLLVYVYLTLYLLLNNIFALLISLLALVICYFYPYVVQLAVLIIFSVFAYIEPYAFHPSLSFSNIIINVIIPLSFIIISFINAVKYGTLSASISSSAVYLLLVNSKTFLPLSITGISLKDKFQSAVISSLPLVCYVLTSYYFIDASKPLSSFIIITILFITSSLLFSINKEFISLMGLIPAIVALYLMFGFSAQVIYSVIIAGVINFTPDIVNTYKRKKTVLHEIMSLKDANRKESQDIQESIGLLKREIKANKEIFEKLNSYSQEVETLRNSNETEKDLKNLQEIQKRLSEISSSLNELVNDYMYNVIVGYNELTYKLKELGLLISTIEVTPQYKSLKDSINAYTNLKKEYESLLREATNKLNSLLRTYNLVLSLKKYNEVSILDASAIDSVSDILL
ncbi:MAG: hypothetical protein JZD40_00315, partial [Sulfolobus sp.]|nr:hypothetical protein [Sulfolobus sp.]